MYSLTNNNMVVYWVYDTSNNLWNISFSFTLLESIMLHLIFSIYCYSLVEGLKAFQIQEARALLGRLEYQKGNIEAALHVFEGIDIAAVIPKIKISLARRSEPPRRNSQSDATLPMSMHAVSLLFEAMLLKTKSLQALGRFPGSYWPSYSCLCIY